MASVSKLALMASASLTATTTTSPQTLKSRAKKFIAHLKVSAVGAGTTATGKLQHSPNNSDWYDFATFAGLAAPGSEVIHETDFAEPNQGLFPYVRGVVALAGGALTATVDNLDLWFDDDR